MQVFEAMVYAVASMIFAASIAVVAWCVITDAIKAARRWLHARTTLPDFTARYGVD